MTGRRTHPRYLLADPLDGHLRVREEVVVERWEETEIEVVTTGPCRPSEHLMLEVPVSPPRPVKVRVVASKPFLTGDGAIRHRVQLSVVTDGEAAVPPGRGVL